MSRCARGEIADARNRRYVAICPYLPPPAKRARRLRGIPGDVGDRAVGERQIRVRGPGARDTGSARSSGCGYQSPKCVRMARTNAVSSISATTRIGLLHFNFLGNALMGVSMLLVVVIGLRGGEV